MRSHIGWKALLIATHITHGNCAQIQLLGLAQHVSVAKKLLVNIQQGIR